MRLKWICILVILTVFVVGCARPPITEMENAREAVFRAENDPNAALYAGSLLIRARESLTRMELEAENKRYDAVKTHAAEAISLAERALIDGRAGAARASGEAAALVNLRPEIEETERNVNGARYSNLPLDYNELDRAIRGVHEAADRAELSQAEGRYQDALDIARDVRFELSEINGRVASAASASKK